MVENSINNKFIALCLTSIQNTFQKIKKTHIHRVFFIQAVDKCRNCMSQQPILMRKSAKNVII